LLEEFGRQTTDVWQQHVDSRRAVRALAAADPWVSDNAARIVDCVPASGEDLAPLLAQIGLSFHVRT
jgi:hypothetical protein